MTIGASLGTFDLENPDPSPGDALRDEAANLLATKYGHPKIEKRACGKKVDIFFTRREFDKEVRTYVEAKDYGTPLTRQQVVTIWTDYSGIIANNKPAHLLLITRQGLATDADTFVNDEQPDMRHQTIWALGNEMIGLTDYVRSLAGLFDEDDLSTYYIPGRAKTVSYNASNQRVISDEDVSVYEEIQKWLASNEVKPLAILGGYGAGKTSLAKRIVSAQAEEALKNPLARRPVLIKLGAFSRFSELAGLLGGMFTHDFPTENFNTHRFLQYNKRGRFLIVLDGFDEMKHAMTWTDFHSTLSELNKLIVNEAKVLLLGRPNAFTSEDEEVHVLRGMKRYDGGWRKIPGWPDFIQFNLESFSLEERKEFVLKYLQNFYPQNNPQMDSRNRLPILRADEVNRLADIEPDIFSKPVHAKILTDLAIDPGVDLKKFEKGISKWGLYDEFFRSLAEREVKKAARRPIGESYRLKFLREVAFWLWSSKGGATSFSMHEIPDTLFTNLPDGDAADLDGKKREYLTGAFLEKKSGDVYYFSHRSFAEFLVAQRMTSTMPTAEDQPVYSNLVKDGVAQFLLGSPHEEEIKKWTETLPDAKGVIHLEYLMFISEIYKGLPKLIQSLPPTSRLHAFLSVFPQAIDFSDSLDKEIISAMRSSDEVLFFQFFTLLQIYGAQKKRAAKNYVVPIAAACLDRVFSTAEIDQNTMQAAIDTEYAESRNLVSKVIFPASTNYGEPKVTFDGKTFLRIQKETLEASGTEIYVHTPVSLLSFAEYTLSRQAILNEMVPENRHKAAEYFQKHKDMKGVFIKSYSSRRRSGSKS